MRLEVRFWSVTTSSSTTFPPALRISVRLVAGLPEGGRALVAGHRPTTEAAVLGVAGQLVPPLGKGEGILLTEDGGGYRVGSLD